MHTIGHNIANAETPGFSRQVAVQQASHPLRAFGSRGMIGSGTQIVSINQVRNSFLDRKFWHQNAVLGQFSKKHDIMSLTQGILREGENVGLTREFSDIMRRIQDLNNDANSMTHRANVTNSFESLTLHLNSTYTALRQQTTDANQEIGAMVGIINSLGIQITSLNRQITTLELNGSNANDLRDQRARLIDELSRFVNIDVQEIETNADFAAGRTTDPRHSSRELIILIDGAPFVNHFSMNTLEVRQRRLDTPGQEMVSRNFEEPPGMYDIFWGNGVMFDKFSHSLSGELKGLIDMRDGNGGNHGFGTSPVFTPGAPGMLSLSFDPRTSRLDFPETGIIQVRNAAGRIQEFHYNGRTMIRNADGTYTIEFDMVEPPTLTQANFDNMDITIGRTTNFRGIPYFMNRLNILARTWAMALNEGRYLDGGDIPDVIGHINSWDLQDPPQRGHILFTFRDPFTGDLVMPSRANIADIDHFNIHMMTAANIAVNPDILRNPSLLAIAGEDPTLGESANLTTTSWANLTSDRGLFRQGRLGDFIAGITGELGVVGRQAYNFTNSYTELLTVIENQRLSVMGVSLDEETSNLIMQQIIFQAAARLISAIDNVYDTLINRLGNW